VVVVRAAKRRKATIADIFYSDMMNTIIIALKNERFNGEK
jgi:hypothetical protein